MGAALIATLALITMGTAEGSAQPAPTPTPSPAPGSSSVPDVATRELPAPEEATDTRVRSRSTVLDGPVATSTADRSLVAGVQSTPAANRVVGTLHAAGGSTVVTPGALTTLASVADRKPSRLAGADRYSTAAQISAAGHPSGSARVYVATGENFPDGLAASRAAAHHGAPLLLTRGTGLPSVTRQELLRLVPTEVIVVGGTGVVSSSVQSAIAQAVPKATIRRIAGANRFETAAALARADTMIPTIAFVATGANFPDALAAGPVAAHQDASLLLATSTSLPTATARELTRTRPKTTVIVGGPDVISDKVRASIASATGGKVQRVSGANRYETAAALSRSVFTGTTSTVVLATGLGFADALSAGALAGSRGGPVLLDAGQARSPRATTDEARRLSWYVGAADGPVLRYVPEVHPDDNMSAGSLLPATPGRYDVFILLTRGEATSYCTGQPVSTRWMNQQFLPQPQPTGQRFSDRCRDHRVDSWHEFLDRLAGPDDPMGQVERHQGQPITKDGRTLPTPTHLMEDGSSRPADYVDVAVGPRSARFVFDLGDGQLTRDKVTWAIENARQLRSLLPTQSEGDIVAGGYFNDTGAGSPYLHADHKILHDVLGTTDFRLPGSQYSPIGHGDPDRAFGAWGGDYCTNMCHPADTNGWANGMGRFQYSYGWLRSGKWETGTLDVHAGFSEYQSFGKWY